MKTKISEAKGKMIFMLVYLAYTSIYIARVNLSVANPVLIEMNAVNASQIGVLGSCFSTVYAIGRLINGGLSDRRPPWQMISLGLGVVALANMLMGLLPPFAAMVLLWSTNAYAQSMLWSSVLCIVSSLYDGPTAKRKSALMVTSVAAGNVLGIVVNTWVITAFGVRFGFIVPGALTLLLGGAVLLFTRQIPAPMAEQKHISVAGLVKNGEIRKMLIPAVFHGVLKENISLWMVVYVIDSFGVNLKSSSYFVLFIPAIGMLGRLLYPVCYKLCKEKEHTVSILGFTAAVIFSGMLCFKIESVVLAVVCLSLVYTAISVVNTSLLSIYPIRYANSGNVASVGGLLDFATYLGAGMGSVIYGATIQHWGYTPMFVSWVALSVISMAVLFGISKGEK